MRRRPVLAGAGVTGALALASEFRAGRSRRALTERWRYASVEARRGAGLGISFRPLQAEALGLSPRDAFRELLQYPFQVVRLAAYWDRFERAPGHFDPGELDWQVEAAEKAGKSVIICTGAVKAFGYPEFFAPAHRVTRPLREGSLVKPTAHPELLAGAVCFTQRVVERYGGHASVVAWQVEHEALDPLGMEHSWRLSVPFVAAEVKAVREADPSRPLIMNCFLPTSWPVAASQRWRTRGQGGSLAGALRMADVVGIDFYPRHALFGAGPWAVYLDGSRSPWHQGWRRRLWSWVPAPSRGAAGTAGALGAAGAAGALGAAGAAGALGDLVDVSAEIEHLRPQVRRRLMVTEGQAEPWEAVTVPPSPGGAVMASCPPERLIDNYNQCMRWQSHPRCPLPLWAYLFWGAEYWLARRDAGDPSYLRAFERVLACS